VHNEAGFCRASAGCSLDSMNAAAEAVHSDVPLRKDGRSFRQNVHEKVQQQPAADEKMAGTAQTQRRCNRQQRRSSHASQMTRQHSTPWLTLVTFRHAVARRLLETAHLQPPAARDATSYTPFSMQDNAISQPASKCQKPEVILIAEAWAAPEPLCRAEDMKSTLSCVSKRKGDCPKPQQTDGLASSLGWGGTGEQSRRFAEAEGQWGSTENTLIAERTPDT